MTPSRVGAARLRHLDLEVSERDVAILDSLSAHRFLTTGQLQRLHFADHASALASIRACVRVLDRLRRLRLVDRLARSVGGLHAGSRAFVWYLDTVGFRLLARESETATTARRRGADPSTTFLEHTLAVAEAHVGLVEQARLGVFDLERVQTEPTAWRRYVDGFGRPAVLKPDLATVTASGPYEDHWFIEVDRGTESIRTLLAKCGQYEAYRHSGREQADHGVYPVVVWIVPDERRRDRLLAEIGRARELPRELFRVVLARELAALVTANTEPTKDSITPKGPHITEGGIT